MKSLSSAGLVILLNLFSFAFGQPQAVSFNPKKGDHIILLGNTFIDRMRHFGYFEMLLQKNFPDKQLTVRNMGWSADEVGLQPRPLNFPGFRNSDAVVSEEAREVSFKKYKFEGEKIVMPIPLNFAGLYQDLTEQRADLIFLCFGMNESFKGSAGLPGFEKDLLAFVDALSGKQFNGKTAPQLILVSPIAHEDLGGYLPNPNEHNLNLERYSRVMQQVASAKGMLFIDLFSPSLARMKAIPNRPITINGIHLTEKGYGEAARWMADQLGFQRKNVRLNFETNNSTKLREVIRMKDDHFFYRWRAVNGEYIYGRRREPFGVLSFPPELKKLTQMASSLDSAIWQFAQGAVAAGYKRAMQIVDERDKPVLWNNVPDVVMKGRQGMEYSMADHSAHQPKVWPATTDSFTLPEGYDINLFASEKDFPVEKPVAMNFDAKGRLWVATMPTYPQYFPGIPVHDRIVILEDTDSDGRADKHTIFADNLYLPLGFEFYNGGIIVSQEPDIVFLKDTDGDDKADLREIILTGFGSEDSHHATHAFTFGQDGALYFNEGTFLNTQVETPYGPVRSYAGATYRFEPRTAKLSHYISYPYYNPWGSVFDKWGTHLIGDASDGSNYFAPPMTGRVSYPAKHPRINMFTTTRVRPTAGIEIISSRQFPEEVQGNFLVNNNIGFQGTKQHEILASGSAIKSKEVESMLRSSDPNFRPIDLKFGPDGALYVVDWYNPLVSHGENPPRDPMRDKLHGRIWRISYKNKPLLQPTDISKQTIPELLENLKQYEDRFRYRSRARLREQAPEKVLPELAKWANNLDPTDPQYEHHLLEVLWLYQDFDVVEPAILSILLEANNALARTAATKVLRYWKDKIPNALALMAKQVNDKSPRVRLEAIVALSHFDGDSAVITALEIIKYPTDYYLNYSIDETFNYLKPVWLAAFKENQHFLADNPKAANFLLRRASESELMRLPQRKVVLEAIITHASAGRSVKEKAVLDLARMTKKNPVEIVLEVILSRNQSGKDLQQFEMNEKDLIEILLTRDQSDLQASKFIIIKFLDNNQYSNLQSIGYAALITADGSDKTSRQLLERKPSSKCHYLRGISMLSDPVLQDIFYTEIKNVATKVPSDSVNMTAYRTLSRFVGHDDERTKMITELIMPNGAYTDLAVEIISSKTDRELAALFAKPTIELILNCIEKTPEDRQSTEQFSNITALGKRLAPFLSAEESETALSILNNVGILEMRLSTLPAKMLFDKERLSVTAGRQVSIIFENPDLMPHNLVIAKPGTAEKVGTAADEMAKLKDGFEKNFIPELSEVLFATPLVNTGQTFQLSFKAPGEPGEYPFICSFPGHWRVMKGILNVMTPTKKRLNSSK